MKRTILATIALTALLLFGSGQNESVVDAATPGTTIKPLLVTCLDVDGSGAVRAPDITKVVLAFGLDASGPSYHFIYDMDANGIQRVPDISKVVAGFGAGPDVATCPFVDVQIAKATQWAIQNAPMTEDVAALAALGYDTGGQDTPGQGVHYTKFENFLTPGFDPQAPEGLVYVDGKLAAQLYFVGGDFIGWQEDPYSPTPGSCSDGFNNNASPPHGDSLTDGADPDCTQSDPGINPVTGQPYEPLDDVNIDALAFICFGMCSWSGTEGWHVHYRLCTYHTDTPFAQSLSLQVGSDSADCEALNSTGCGCGGYTFGYRVGWMGHLWNHLPNANLLPDEGATMNGRFADCYPDAEGWKAYNCPQ